MKTIEPDKAYLKNHLWLPVHLLAPSKLNVLLTSLVVSSGSGDHPLYHYERGEPHILLPRTYCDRLDSLGVSLPVEDLRPQSYERVPYRSTIELDTRRVGGKSVPTGSTLQREAAEALAGVTLGGVLQLFCGAGKTVVALDAIAREQKPVIVVTDNLELMEQWRSSFHRFLQVPWSDLVVAKTSVEPYCTAPVIFTTYASLASVTIQDGFHEAQQRFHRVFFDEAHHVSALYYARCAEAITGGRIGLTATPDRVDGLHVIQRAHIGPVFYKNLKAPLKPTVHFFRSNYRPKEDTDKVKEGMELARLAGFLGQQEERVARVGQKLHELLDQGRKVLVLSASVTALANLMAFAAGIPERTLQEERIGLIEQVLRVRPDFGVLTAEVSKKNRNERARCMFAVRKYGREGYDDEALDTVLLLEPVADPGLVTQILGRPTRLYPGKKEPLVVVVEDDVNALRQRCKVMRSQLRAWPEEAGGKVEFQWT